MRSRTLLYAAVCQVLVYNLEKTIMQGHALKAKGVLFGHDSSCNVQ